MSWEATSVVVEHTIPTLCVTVGSKLRVTTGMIIESINPTFCVTHDQLLDIWRRACLCTTGPTVTSFSTVVCYTQPTLCHTLLCSKDPPGAFWFTVADIYARFNAWNGKLIWVLAIVEETTSGGSISRYVCEERLPRISDHSVLFDAMWPCRLAGSCHHHQCW